MLGQIDFPPFCFQTNHQFLNLIMDESGRQVGWLRKCYLVCIIDNIAADMRSPEPVVSHQSRSHLLSRLWLPGSGLFTDSEQSPVTQQDWTCQQILLVNISEKV